MYQEDIELEEAYRIIEASTKGVTETEEKMLSEADGYVTAEDIKIGFDVPPFPRSPLDGFAIRSIDTKGATEENPAVFRIIDTGVAGAFCTTPMGAGEAVRIFTGAPIPKGADCIAWQEDSVGWDDENRFRTFENGTEVKIVAEYKPWENYSFQGEEIKAGTVVVPKNHRITYIESGVLSSAGIDRVKVYRKPKVGVFVTGSELMKPGEPLKPGKIYDANLQFLSVRLKELGYAPEMTGMLPDDSDEVAKILSEANDRCDLVITSGGVSVGAKDIIHLVLPKINAEKIFWGVRMKPGSPAIFSMRNGKPMVHLSGNPFAALTTFELLAKEALRKLSHDETLRNNMIYVTLGESFSKHRGRRFIRAILENDELHFPKAEKQTSGNLMSMVGCNCIAELPPQDHPYEKGDRVRIFLL